MNSNCGIFKFFFSFSGKELVNFKKKKKKRARPTVMIVPMNSTYGKKMIFKGTREH